MNKPNWKTFKVPNDDYESEFLITLLNWLGEVTEMIGDDSIKSNGKQFLITEESLRRVMQVQGDAEAFISKFLNDVIPIDDDRRAKRGTEGV